MRFVVAAAALAAAVGGALAYAGPGGGDAIRGCVTDGLGGGGLRVLEAGQECKDNETPLSWSQRGPAGPAGEPGPAGPTGPRGEPGPPGSARAFTDTRFAPPGSTETVDVQVGFGGEVVLSRDLPAGRYTLSATAVVSRRPADEETGNPLFEHCSLRRGNREIFRASTDLDDFREGVWITALAMSGAVELDEPASIHVLCFPTNSTSDPDATFTVSARSLVATQVDSLE